MSRVSECPVCKNTKEIGDGHEMCMSCWAQNGEPHPDSYSVDEHGWIVYD